jgi:hypothetical protein
VSPADFIGNGWTTPGITAVAQRLKGYFERAAYGAVVPVNDRLFFCRNIWWCEPLFDGSVCPEIHADICERLPCGETEELSCYKHAREPSSVAKHKITRQW